MPASLNKYLDPAALDETVVNIRQIVEGLEEEMQDLPYARPDGLYPDMTVGAVIGADETAQWAQRESTGSGSATVRSVQGAAWVYNQRCRPQSFWTNNSTIETVDGVTTVTGTADSALYFGMVPSPSPLKGFVPNHKYFVMADVDPSGITSSAFAGLIFNLGSYALTTLSGTNLLTQAGRLAAIVMSSATFDYASLYLTAQFNAMSDTSGQYFTASNIQCFDLTQMFGAGREPSTAAEFQAMLLDDYYEYSTGTLKPVQIAGIRSTDAQGGELDSVEWEAQTLRAAGSVADVLYADHVDVKVGAVDLGTLNWEMISGAAYFVVRNGLSDAPAKQINTMTIPNAECARYTPSKWNNISSSASTTDDAIGVIGAQLALKDTSYTTVADLKASLDGVYLFYELETPTTQPISPALPMTYRVEQGGSESIIVPAGEVSAAPVLTVAEPVNMSTELARIWEAIQSLGYTRNTAQLSRPVSLTDIGSIDETQKDTTEITEIETSKEVQE